MALKVEYLKTEELTPYAGNAKLHPAEQIEQIKRSIEEFGFNDPIAIWGADNTIIEGHGRLIAAEELGIEKVPVIRLDELTDEQRKAYTLVHNKLTMNTDFSFDILQAELDEINNIDMTEFGFEFSEEDPQEEWTDEVEKIDPTEILPKSRMMVCSVSAFWTNSEKLFEIPIDAGVFLQKVEEIGAEEITEKLRGAVNGL